MVFSGPLGYSRVVLDTIAINVALSAHRIPAPLQGHMILFFLKCRHHYIVIAWYPGTPWNDIIIIINNFPIVKRNFGTDVVEIV